MIEVITDLPDRVLGVKASGEVATDDYKTVLVPAIEEKLTRHKKIRRVPLISADRLVSAIPRIASRFVDAAVRAFPIDAHDEALLGVGGP
jgi:hypothetical protein